MNYYKRRTAGRDDPPPNGGTFSTDVDDDDDDDDGDVKTLASYIVNALGTESLASSRNPFHQQEQQQQQPVSVASQEEEEEGEEGDYPSTIHLSSDVYTVGRDAAVDVEYGVGTRTEYENELTTVEIDDGVGEHHTKKRDFDYWYDKPDPVSNNNNKDLILAKRMAREAGESSILERSFDGSTIASRPATSLISYYPTENTKESEHNTPESPTTENTTTNNIRETTSFHKKGGMTRCTPKVLAAIAFILLLGAAITLAVACGNGVCGNSDEKSSTVDVPPPTPQPEPTTTVAPTATPNEATTAPSPTTPVAPTTPAPTPQSPPATEPPQQSPTTAEPTTLSPTPATTQSPTAAEVMTQTPTTLPPGPTLLEMCEPCDNASECQSNECTVGFCANEDNNRCNDVPCRRPSQCISGRCAADRTCQDKLTSGLQCDRDSDCESDQCTSSVCE